MKYLSIGINIGAFIAFLATPLMKHPMVAIFVRDKTPDSFLSASLITIASYKGIAHLLSKFIFKSLSKNPYYEAGCLVLCFGTYYGVSKLMDNIMKSPTQKAESETFGNQNLQQKSEANLSLSSDDKLEEIKKILEQTTKTHTKVTDYILDLNKLNPSEDDGSHDINKINDTLNTIYKLLQTIKGEYDAIVTLEKANQNGEERDKAILLLYGMAERLKYIALDNKEYRDLVFIIEEKLSQTQVKIPDNATISDYMDVVQKVRDKFEYRVEYEDRVASAIARVKDLGKFTGQRDPSLERLQKFLKNYNLLKVLSDEYSGFMKCLNCIDNKELDAAQKKWIKDTAESIVKIDTIYIDLIKDIQHIVDELEANQENGVKVMMEWIGTAGSSNIFPSVGGGGAPQYKVDPSITQKSINNPRCRNNGNGGGRAIGQKKDDLD